jgi:Trk-type K+ transport system membrane component
MPIVRLHVLVSSARHVATSSVFLCRLVALHLSPLLLHLSYFLAIDLLGFLALVVLRPSGSTGGYRPRYVDVFFMSTSAATVTGLATVKMEDLSSSQIVVLTLLMLLGSEMFVSFLGLVLESRKRRRRRDHDQQDGRVRSVVTVSDDDSNLEAANPSAGSDDERKESWCLGSLALALLAYMAMVIVLGSLSVFAYVAGVPSARDVLARKGISTALFSASVTVSSFTNGGLIPTNESMAVFAANRGLLLLLAGQILAGNTLLPVFLRLVIWSTRGLAARASAGRRGSEEGIEVEAVAKDAVAAGFGHLLLPGLQTAFLAVTVVAVAAATATLLCFLNWDSAVFAGLTAGEKVTNAVFMAVNLRQAGENSIDCSLLAPPVLVLFVAMMSVTRSLVPLCSGRWQPRRELIVTNFAHTFQVHSGHGDILLRARPRRRSGRT